MKLAGVKSILWQQKNEITEKFLVSREVVNLRGKWENKPIQGRRESPPPTHTPPNPLALIVEIIWQDGKLEEIV